MLRFQKFFWECPLRLSTSCSPTDYILRLMTIWRITGKIIRTAIAVAYAHL